jgi:hypothetical protein
MWKNILPCVHGWMIFMDEKNGWILFWMLAINVIFQKNEQKNKVETIYVGFFQHKSTNEMLKSQFIAIF